MARTPLLRRFERLSRRVVSGDTRGKTTRRSFLKSTAAAGAVIAGSSLAGASSEPRIVIDGAGIAGLTAALTLADNGYSSPIYEASNRVSGRMHSNATSWLNGQVTSTAAS